jgi:hypothetical protein
MTTHKIGKDATQSIDDSESNMPGSVERPNNVSKVRPQIHPVTVVIETARKKVAIDSILNNLSLLITTPFCVVPP